MLIVAGVQEKGRKVVSGGAKGTLVSAQAQQTKHLYTMKTIMTTRDLRLSASFGVSEVLKILILETTV